MLVWKSSPKLVLLMLSFTVLNSVNPIAALYLSKHLIDSILNQASILESTVAAVLPLLAMLLGIMIIGHIITIIYSSLSSILQIRVEQNVQTSIIRKCAGFDLAFYDNPSNLNVLNNASMGGTGYIYSTTNQLFSIIESLIMLLGFLIILINYNSFLFIIIVATSIPSIFVKNYFIKKKWTIENSMAEPRRMRAFLGSMVSSRDFVKEIKIYSLFTSIIKRYAFFNSELLKIESRYLKKKCLAQILIAFLPILGGGLAWIIIINDVLIQAVTIGGLIYYTGAVKTFQSRLNSFFISGTQLFQTLLFLHNYYHLMDMDRTNIEGSIEKNRRQIVHTLNHAKNFSRGIEFQDVSFHYPGCSDLVLKNLTFRLEPNQITAIVGRNGAGKTTLVKLMMRLYDPVCGRILLEGRDIREYDIEAVYKCFGIVFQDYIRFPLTIRENIGFGDSANIDNLVKIEEAARRAKIDMDIDKLPKKYETYLGKMFMGSGEDLSIGQWQKVSIARAFMRKDSPALILDEPSASLDSFAEHDLFLTLKDMLMNKLALIISHRFSTVKMADQIIVLDNGKIVESGTHIELINSKNLYEEMFRLQADKYSIHATTSSSEKKAAFMR